MSYPLSTLSETAFQEVIDVHVLIEQCFRGEVNDPISAKKTFLDHFHPDFYMITPAGTVIQKGGLDQWFSNAIGTRAGNNITIVNCVARLVTPETVMVTYEEEQRFANEFLKRTSTAIFVPKPNSNKELLWLHLHETWIK